MAASPRDQLLVSANWLAGHLSEDGIRIVEMAQDQEQFL